MTIYVWALLIFLGVIYFNIGYWGGKSWVNSLGKKADLNWFQRFQVGTESEVLSTEFDLAGDESLYMVFSVIAWPVGLTISSTIWAVKLIFLGGFFRFIREIFW